MSLETVTMKKGREHKPRLSKPYDPTKTPDIRFWSGDDDEILREFFPKGGAAACKAKLPQRSMTAIYGRANKLELKAPSSNNHGRKNIYQMTPALEQQMRETWPRLIRRGDVTRFAEETLKLPKWWVLKQAVKLGLTNVQKKEPPWTEAETALMSKVPLHDPARAAAMFREHGFNRTPTSIVVRAKRLNLSRRYRATLSATSAAKILGIDSKTVTSWCIAGELKAVKRETQRLPQQGGNPWSIERADLRQYVIDNIERLDIRKVEKMAFVDLLVNVG